MSPEAWIALAGLVFVALGVMLGAAWWMSALYGQVGSIKDNTEATSTKLDTLTQKMDGHIEDLRSDVTDLQIRMVRVEGQIDTERE